MIKSSVSMSSKASVHGRLSMLWTLQLLVNKYRANETASLCNIMQDIVSTCSTKDDTEAQYILQTLAYFASASLAALQPSATKLINLMVAGVSDPKHGQIYASSFRILLSPSPIINKENSCILRSLRKTKLFHLIFHPLHKAWIAGDRKIKNNTLIALSGVLSYLDAETYTDPAIASLLLPLILDGCDIQDNVWAKARFISTLSVLVSNCPVLIDEYRKSVITRLTDRTHNTLDSPSDSDVTSRGLALDVLTNIIKTLPPASILKEKTRLTTELNFALNDPSRDVRERAQRCKTALLCLVEPAVDS
jgi:DNA repair/transcription protein MET18/MMS19